MSVLDGILVRSGFGTLPADFYLPQTPTPLPAPCLVAFNAPLAEQLGLPAEPAASLVEQLAGNALAPNAQPLAAVYAGHQFGVYVPRLGDGRALLLGDIVTDHGRYELQLKGAGRTPFSRGADGRAVLRSTIREYLASEAMHGLGIPTTRALAIVGSDQPVYRERIETAAVLSRLAPSHVRFGSFEYFHYRGMGEQVRTLADFVIGAHFAPFAAAADRYAQLLDAVARRTARLVAAWQAQGFVHGVMNTDNMSILGLTLDYGPYGFLDHFEAARVFNHTDRRGRYAYANQAGIALWNLQALAEALSSLIDAATREAVLARFEPEFVRAYGELMCRKLGLRESRAGDADLIDRLLQALQDGRVDYPAFMRRLGAFRPGDAATRTPLLALSHAPLAIDAWLDAYAARLASEADADAVRQSRMDAVNPLYVLRTHLAERAIHLAVEQRDYDQIDRLHRLLAQPFTAQPGSESYAEPPAHDVGEIVLSCSS
ncbi:YdiU family protein [Immundisolibacter sp.]|uniref:protein adenylyltransferase SelO n=1 Tax=Immundisolibacter sp. TaxID=1934948 RepID=UPI0026322D35|nr:YdiU family protein [Immundisolibacter sp.]MDD3652124.1 YdiU family protein [Immundisolibacter sp.]